jgi:glutathione S-transferase
MDRATYTYFRSPTSYRVRIAPNLKELDVRRVPFNLARSAGAQFDTAYQTNLDGKLAVPKDATSRWIIHWVASSLRSLEAQLARSGRSGRFSVGDTPAMADCCLVPQLSSARRFGVDLAPFERLAIDQECQGNPTFRRAHPSMQGDAE